MRLGCPPVAERSYEGSRISVDLFINGNGGRSLISDILSSYCTVHANGHMCLSRCTALLFPSTFYFIVPLTPYVVHMLPTVLTCVFLVQSIISLQANFYLSTLLSLYKPTFTSPIYYLSISQILPVQSIISP